MPEKTDEAGAEEVASVQIRCTEATSSLCMSHKRESVLQLNMVPLDSLHESREKDRGRRRVQTVNSHAPGKTIPRASRILFFFHLLFPRGILCGEEIPGWRDSLNVDVRSLINKVVGTESVVL